MAIRRRRPWPILGLSYMRTEQSAPNEDLLDQEGIVRMTLGEHLEDLRRRIILALHGFLPGLIIGLCIGKSLVNLISYSVLAETKAFYQAYSGMGLLTLGAQEVFMVYMKASIIAGLMISSPWVIFQLWAFVAEGLSRHERRTVYRAMPMSIGLFLFGVVFGFVVVLPAVIRYHISFNKWMNVGPSILLSEWLGFATSLPGILGVCFQLPLVMLVLEKGGILRYEDYKRYWPHAILAIAIIAMVVTPTTDPGSMMLLMAPMAALYGLGLGLVRARHVKERGTI